jgi:hypothetical protein
MFDDERHLLVDTINYYFHRASGTSIINIPMSLCKIYHKKTCDIFSTVRDQMIPQIDPNGSR